MKPLAAACLVLLLIASCSRPSSCDCAVDVAALEARHEKSVSALEGRLDEIESARWASPTQSTAASSGTSDVAEHVLRLEARVKTLQAEVRSRSTGGQSTSPAATDWSTELRDLDRRVRAREERSERVTEIRSPGGDLGRIQDQLRDVETSVRNLDKLQTRLSRLEDEFRDVDFRLRNVERR